MKKMSLKSIAEKSNEYVGSLAHWFINEPIEKLLVYD
jgi:hypothetical protein